MMRDTPLYTLRASHLVASVGQDTNLSFSHFKAMRRRSRYDFGVQLGGNVKEAGRCAVREVRVGVPMRGTDKRTKGRKDEDREGKKISG